MKVPKTLPKYSLSQLIPNVTVGSVNVDFVCHWYEGMNRAVGISDQR